MKKYLLILVSLVITLISSTSFAYSPPEPDGYVMDMAGKLSAEQKAQLNAKLSELNKTSKNEFAALILPSMNGENIEDVAQDTFRSWKVGKAGLDNGVLVVIAIAERKSRIQTGKGVEGDLTDIQSNDILVQHLNPHLKKGEFYEGLNETFDSIASTVESRAGTAVPKPNTESVNTAAVIMFLGIFGGIIGIIVLFIYFSTRKSKEDIRRENEMNSKLDALKYKNTYYHTDPLPYMAPVIAPSRTIKPKAKKSISYSESISYPDTPSNSSSSSSSSSSSLFDSFSSGGGDSGFGGFGGGDSGGGGSSSDW